MVYIILISYLALTFWSSLIGSKTKNETPESYFLADRNLGVITLFFTLIATNFSAFFFLGFAGVGYKLGYSFYAEMAFGTTLAALSFFLIGNKVWKLGKEKGYITPIELIHKESNNSFLKWVYLITMMLFTFPYIAIQPQGAGILLESLTQEEISSHWGAILLTIIIIIYVLIGGMKSVAKTDVKQGVMMIILMIAAVFAIAYQLGGLDEAHQKVFDIKPELFSKDAGGKYTPQKWFSVCILWIACVPMFPQLFMRFFISKDLKTFKTSTLLYAIIPFFLFLLPVIIGVLGHLSFPDLSTKKEIDYILPKMLVEHTAPWFYTLVMTGALAAFMSTLDSQLLALSTITTRDIYLPFSKKKISLQQQVNIGRIGVIIFAFIGLIIALNPIGTIEEIIKMAFSGLAVLFPTTLFVLHYKKTNATACAISIIVGELIIIGMNMGWISKESVLGFDAVVPALFLSTLIIIIGSILYPKNK